MYDLLTQGVLMIIIILVAMFSLLVLIIVYLTNPIDKNGDFSDRIKFTADFDEEMKQFEEENRERPEAEREYRLSCFVEYDDDKKDDQAN